MTRKKSDHLDPMTLANILRTDAQAHRPLPVDTELAQAVTVLTRVSLFLPLLALNLTKYPPLITLPRL